MKKEEFMKLGIDEAFKTLAKNIGGPFGAAIVKGGKLVCVASNTVLRDNDPTANAEMNAIRIAGKILETYDLTGCELYATGYPCPMCLSAIIWANIKTVHYGCTPEDAAKIGFRDDFIYDFIVALRNNKEDKSLLGLSEVSRKECLSLFETYTKNQKTIY